MVRMHSSTAVTLLDLASALVLPAHAADVVVPAPVFVRPVEVPPPPDFGWTFAIAPYLWAAGLEGTIAQFGAPPIDVDLSFGDIFDHLKFGGMVVTEARYGRFGLFGDLIYVKLGADVDGPLGGVISLTTSTFVGTALGEYRLIDGPGGSLDAWRAFESGQSIRTSN